jgi:hypothetical protein
MFLSSHPSNTSTPLLFWSHSLLPPTLEVKFSQPFLKPEGESQLLPLACQQPLVFVQTLPVTGRHLVYLYEICYTIEQVCPTGSRYSAASPLSQLFLYWAFPTKTSSLSWEVRKQPPRKMISSEMEKMLFYS